MHRVTVQIVEAGVGDFLHKKYVYVMLINAYPANVEKMVNS